MKLSEALYALAEHTPFQTEGEYREVLATIADHADHIDRAAPDDKPDGDDGEPAEVTGDGDKDLAAAETAAKKTAPGTRRR